jgi:hypothetical protein
MARALALAASLFPQNYSGFSRFPSFYFGAADAPQGAAELAQVARYALAGWGWQQSFDAPPKGAGGEAKGAAAAAALRARAPRGGAGAPDALFVYRQSESLFTYYESFAAVAASPALLAAATLADPATGKPCGGGGLLGFSNATFTAYLTDVVGAELAGERNVDAVFFDGFDKLYGGNTLAVDYKCAGFTPAATAAELRAKVAAFAALARALNAAGKVPLLSSFNYLAAPARARGFAGAAAPLAAMNGVYEDEYVAAFAAANATFARFYEVWLGHGAEIDGAMVANALAEGRLGVPFVARSQVGTMHTLEYGAIGFLIAQERGCFWGASSGWLDKNQVWSGIDLWDVGAPLGAAVEASAGVWTRAFARANATVDTRAGTASLRTAAGGWVDARR